MHNLAVHILLIEDDLDLGRALQAALKVDGLSSEWHRRAADAPRDLAATAFDCVLLDLSLPDGNGFDLLTRWRRDGCSVPVIVITARSAVEDRLAGPRRWRGRFRRQALCDGGADLTHSRRAATLGRQASEMWTLGALVLEPRRHRASLHGETLDLSPREFRLLLELAREPGAVVAKGVLARKLEPLGEPLDFAAIEVHVSNLRRKIGSTRVHTVRGVGYLLAS